MGMGYGGYGGYGYGRPMGMGMGMPLGLGMMGGLGTGMLLGKFHLESKLSGVHSLTIRRSDGRWIWWGLWRW